MSTAEGYCPQCPCWFDIPDTALSANHLCPCCLRPATKVRHGNKSLRRVAHAPRRMLRLLRSVVLGS